MPSTQSSENGAAGVGNTPEFSVSEISSALKRTIEDTFGYVRVRGEIGRVTRPASGHIYLDLKDEKAVLSSVVWKGSAGRLKIKPEQGLEVICTGRLTTFGPQSKYQMVIEHMEPAGVGALMALLEERRKKLAAEGLFDPERKKAIPFLPDVIGVVSSPSGAVIRDIMHRIDDRFPRLVLLWPSLVQGEKAAEQVAAGIRGFNALPKTGHPRRPDVLIVARGGGSLEDLWAFNEEVVVRAAAESEIPLISAVGHETDTTLIDFASDFRAPTPTAAAERAVPVRAELLAAVLDLEQRLVSGTDRFLRRAGDTLQGLARAIPRLEDLLSLPSQKLDFLSGRLAGSLDGTLTRKTLAFEGLGARLRFDVFRERMDNALIQLGRHEERLAGNAERLIKRGEDRLRHASSLLDALSYQKTLERGYVLVSRASGELVRAQADLSDGEAVRLTFHDGVRGAVIEGGDAAGDDPAGDTKVGDEKPDKKKPARKKGEAAQAKKPAPRGQGQLF